MGFCRRRRSTNELGIVPVGQGDGSLNPAEQGRSVLPPYHFSAAYFPIKDRSDLENVALAGYDFVEDWVDEEAQEQAREQARDNDDGDGLLRVAAYAGGHGGGKKTEAGDERGHHNGAKAEKRSAQGSFADGFALQAKFIDVADENDCRF